VGFNHPRPSLKAASEAKRCRNRLGKGLVNDSLHIFQLFWAMYSSIIKISAFICENKSRHFLFRFPFTDSFQSDKGAAP
jgi:hypothetical protein